MTTKVRNRLRLTVEVAMVAALLLLAIAFPAWAQDRRAMIFTDYDSFPQIPAEVLCTDEDGIPQFVEQIRQGHNQSYDGVNVPGLGMVTVGGGTNGQVDVDLYVNDDEPSVFVEDRIGGGLFAWDPVTQQGLPWEVNIPTQRYEAVYWPEMHRVFFLAGTPGSYCLATFDPYRLLCRERGTYNYHEINMRHHHEAIPDEMEILHPIEYGNLRKFQFPDVDGNDAQTVALWIRDPYLYVVFREGRVMRWQRGTRAVTWHQIPMPIDPVDGDLAYFGSKVSARGIAGWWITVWGWTPLGSDGDRFVRKVMQNCSWDPEDWTVEERRGVWPLYHGPPRWMESFEDGIGVSMSGSTAAITVTLDELTATRTWPQSIQDDRYAFSVHAAIMPDHTVALIRTMQPRATPGERLHELTFLQWFTLEDAQPMQVLPYPGVEIQWLVGMPGEGHHHE